jgi:hypothetical protein
MIGGDRSPMLRSIFDYEYHTEGCTNKDGKECGPQIISDVWFLFHMYTFYLKMLNKISHTRNFIVGSM